MTDAEAETPILWPPDVKSQLTGKDPDAGKDRGQEKGTTCCSPQGHKVSDTTEKTPPSCSFSSPGSPSLPLAKHVVRSSILWA